MNSNENYTMELKFKKGDRIMNEEEKTRGKLKTLILKGEIIELIKREGMPSIYVIDWDHYPEATEYYAAIIDEEHTLDVREMRKKTIEKLLK